MILRQYEREKISIKIQKKEIKLSLFTNDVFMNLGINQNLQINYKD